VLFAIFYSQAQSGKCLGRAVFRCSENITVSGLQHHENTHASACSVAPHGGLCGIAKPSSEQSAQQQNLKSQATLSAPLAKKS
jgi:hypothetical protein